MPEWKQKKIMSMKEFVNEAKNEVELFDKERRIIFLQQAGNKLYNAHAFYIEAKVGREIESSDDLSIQARKIEHKTFRKIRRNVLALHKWFYEGIEDEQEARSMIVETIILFNQIY